MRNTEVTLLTELIERESEANRLLMEDVRRTVAVAAAHTDGRLEELNKTIKIHNGRLKECEGALSNHQKTIGVIRWAGKHWYVTLGVILLLIGILIPLVDVIGLKELISIIK
jgi:hypothetical protein